MIDRSVKAQRSAVLRSTVESKDFAEAHRKADALKQLFPDRNDGSELDKEITNIESANANAHRPLSPGLGVVDVYTTPAGRQVYIDGRSVGISPVRNLSVEAGTHRFSWDDVCANYIDTQVRANEYTKVKLGCGTRE